MYLEREVAERIIDICTRFKLIEAIAVLPLVQDNMEQLAKKLKKGYINYAQYKIILTVFSKVSFYLLLSK
jgi:phosphoribosylamine-glycine ligase